MRGMVYVQKRVDGLEKIRLYLHGEKILYNKHYNITVGLHFLVRIEIVSALGEWNLRRVWDLVNENDLRIEYSENRLQVFC